MTYFSGFVPVPLNPRTDVTTEAKLNQLCEKCSRIAYHVSMFQKSCSIDPDNPTVHLINHHESSSALVTSARAGCHLCTLLIRELKELMSADWQVQELELGIMDKQSGRLAMYQIELCGYLEQRRIDRKRDRLRKYMSPFIRPTFECSGFDRHVSIRLFPQIPDGGTRHQVAGDARIGKYGTAMLSISHITAKDPDWIRQDPSISTASPSSFAVARRWLRDCKELHSACRHGHAAVASNALPTRLIDVGSLDVPATCQLFLPGQPSDRVEYLTLSHKWGDAIVYKLTKATLEPMLQGISLNHLPLTFQHAILITRNLGYRYIWIDSLCIIQDDVDDWAFESTTMSRIYSNSVLTIAALWGENSHAGCYVERNPLTTEDCYIGEWKHGEVVVTSGDVRRGSTLGNLGPTPLLHRAWVVQERFLSPRTLYFGPWELFWECGEQTSRERWPEISFPRWDDVAIKQRFRNIPGLDLNKSHRKPELESIYKIWTAIRANYWSSQLTYHSDSLVAISGITTWIQERSGLQFVSGLCKNFFLRELLWKVENNFVTSRSTLGPTWSWASVKGAKIKGFHQPSITSKTHTIHTRLESIDDLFSMNEGHQLKDIHLRGPLLHGTLKRDEYGFFVTDDYRLQNFNYDLDIPLPDTVEIVCLVLAESNRDAEAIISAPDAGLILVPDSYESSTYQRVGMWSHPSFKRPGGILAEPADWQSIRLV